MPHTSPKKWRSSLVLILCVFAIGFVRQVNIAAFPPFLDEGVFMRFAEDQATISPLIHAEEGRLFTLWWYRVFSPFAAGGFWLARTITLLLILPGTAAVIATGRLAAGRYGAALTGLLLLFSTYHHFFNRLAMADSLAASGVAVSVYFAYRLRHRASLWDAALCGGALFVALGFKVTILPYFGVPVAAVLALGWQHPARQRIRWLGVGLGVCLGLTGLFALGLRLFGYNYFFLYQYHTASTAALLPRIAANAAIMLDTARGYLGLPLVILGALATATLLIRRQFFLPIVLIAPALALSASSKQSTRFYETPVVLLLLITAVALAHLAAARSRAFRAGMTVALILWGAATWLPFSLQTAADPASMPLYRLTRNEYVEGDASGFGLAEAQAILHGLQPDTVYGLLANCQGLRYLSLHDFAVECPRVNPNGEDIPALAALLADNRRPGAFAVVEESPYIPDRAPGTLLAVIEDASGRPTLSIYDLAP